jgi:hypothetical protein
LFADRFLMRFLDRPLRFCENQMTPPCSTPQVTRRYIEKVLSFLYSCQPSPHFCLMVVMEMIKEFTRLEACIAHPHKIVRWFDPFDPDFIG